LKKRNSREREPLFIIFLEYLKSFKMASIAQIMLAGNEKFHGQNLKSWKQKMLAIFEYRCLDKLVLGK